MMFNLWCLWPKRKKLLVLDLDHTLADLTSRDELVPFHRRIRPHLDFFLTVADRYFNIVIWSATSAGILYHKLTQLQLLQNPQYSIWFCLDSTHMQWIRTSAGKVGTKPLSVIWRSYSNYNATNTLIIDDSEINFYFNQKNGLKIEPYYLENFSTDTELLQLTDYIKSLANCRNFSKRDHTIWRQYVE